MKRAGFFPVLVAGLLVAATTNPADEVENATYKSWANQKVGTTLAYSITLSAQKMIMHEEVSQTLRTISADQVTLDVSSQFDELPKPSRSILEVHSKVPRGQECVPPDYVGSTEEVGHETIVIGGRQYECTVYQLRGTGPQSQMHGSGSAIFDGDVKGRIWRSALIPGGLAKMEITYLLGDPGGTEKSTMKMIIRSMTSQ
jgi:hypothetical protein